MRSLLPLAIGLIVSPLAIAGTMEPKVDLLVVIDDSGSMADEQEKIQHELPPLLRYLSDTDWQIGVVTTSSSCLRNERIIKAGDQDAEQAFSTAVAAGTNGSANERGINSAIRALSGRCDGEAPIEWIRPDSTLAVFFASDEDSYCPASGCGDGDRWQDLRDELRTLRPDPMASRAYAQIWTSNDPSCSLSNGENEGRKYVALVQAIGGLTGSLCEADYSRFLEQVSRDLRRAAEHHMH